MHSYCSMKIRWWLLDRMKCKSICMYNSSRSAFTQLFKYPQIFTFRFEKLKNLDEACTLPWFSFCCQLHWCQSCHVIYNVRERSFVSFESFCIFCYLCHFWNLCFALYVVGIPPAVSAWSIALTTFPTRSQNRWTLSFQLDDLIIWRTRIVLWIGWWCECEFRPAIEAKSSAQSDDSFCP